VRRITASVLAAVVAALLFLAPPADAATNQKCHETNAPGDNEMCVRTWTYANGDAQARIFFRGDNLSWINSDAGYNVDVKMPFRNGTHDLFGSTIPKSGETTPVVCCAKPTTMTYDVTVRLNNWPDDRITGSIVVN
jgi:hypothetical protein